MLDSVIERVEEIGRQNKACVGLLFQNKHQKDVDQSNDEPNTNKDDQEEIEDMEVAPYPAEEDESLGTEYL